MTRRIILWKDNEPYLYCEYEGGNLWHVLNGGWSLELKDDLSGIVVKKGYQVQFDKITEVAEEEYDEYNEVLRRARQNA